MRRMKTLLRFSSLGLGAVVAALLVLPACPPAFVGPAHAQAQKTPSPPAKTPRRGPRALIPDGGAERALLLDELYAHLATAASEEAAQLTSQAIEHVWLKSGSETVNLLMERALKAVNEKKSDLALKLLDAVVELAPDYAEGWNRRAYVLYSRNEYARALGDLRRVLALDPNHFKALDGLAQILRELDYKKEALQVYRRLLEVHPYMASAKSAVEELSREVEGQGI
ncbi:MAG TPA: tetratricopeptide repeat protein [Hyphomicrobiaceae bacterium]|nr:tetratricopeptide repeat protein [Hyphomicrobiaceae bacterium]